MQVLPSLMVVFHSIEQHQFFHRQCQINHHFHGMSPQSPPPVVGSMEHATSVSMTTGGASMRSWTDRIAYGHVLRQMERGHQCAEASIK